jgi:predicted amidohydrolase YtcJ
VKSLLVLCTLLASINSSDEVIAGAADLVLYGGHVVTRGDDATAFPVTAIAVAGGRILHLGDDASVLALATAETRRVELAGAVVVPGFIDSHAHLHGLGKALSEIDLVGTSSPQEVVARVGAAHAANPGESWLQGRGWDQNDWPEAKFPHRSWLDEAVGGRPVLLRRIDGHAAWASSAALELAGIDGGTPDPPGGAILRDSAGVATGILVDNAVDLVRDVIPAVDATEIRRRLQLAMAACVRHGLTGVHEAGVPWERLAVYQEMATAGELDLRVYAMLADDPETLERGFAQGPFVHPGGMLVARAVKLYADGALGSRGALLLDDYSDEPGHRGLLVTPRAHLRDVMKMAKQAGFQVATHAIGDGGNRLVLDLYAEVLGEAKDHDHRWRIEHAQIIAPEDLPRFAALGVVAAMQPLHCTSDMDWAVARLGEDRLAGAYAWRTLLDSGAHVCFGTDFPVEIVDPLAGLFAARTRQHPDGTPAGGWRAHECLTGLTALELYTAGSAFAAFQEAELGRLAVGYRADLTVLDGDPAEVSPGELLDMRVLMTIVDGRVVYDTLIAPR